MKINQKIYEFLLVILLLALSYSLCSTHERPVSGYVSRRKSFCSVPFYLILSVTLIFYLIRNFNGLS